jgi:hypothetical protein
VYWNDFHNFSTDIELEAEIAELAVPASDTARAIGTDTRSQYLYINRIATGLQIGVIAATERSERIPVALLPWAEFGIPQWRHGTASRKKRDRLLVQHGWTRVDEHFDTFVAHSLQHRYARVDWTYI